MFVNRSESKTGNPNKNKLILYCTLTDNHSRNTHYSCIPHTSDHGRKSSAISDAPKNVNHEKFLKLEIKAELENVTDFTPSSDDFEFFFKVIVGNRLMNCILTVPCR
jgi:hypothetical protein